MGLSPVSRRPCCALWWLGLSQTSIQGTRAGSVSGMLCLWESEWIAATEKNQFPNLLLLIFAWLMSCERALGTTCYCTSPSAFPCMPIAAVHVWAWRQRWKRSLLRNCIVLQQAFKHGEKFSCFNPGLFCHLSHPCLSEIFPWGQLA